MDDFTKPVIANVKSLNQEKQDEWLTKDRFWNFVFWFGMSGGLAIAFTISGINQSPQKFSYWSTCIFWLTILGVPLLVRYFTKTTFVKDTIFLTSEGREFDVAKKLPNKFLTNVSTLVLTALLGTILDKKLSHISDVASSFMLTLVFFGVPTLFFIFKNCPISILFNYKFWKLHLGKGVCYINRPHNHFSSSSSSGNRSSSSDYYTNPVYSSSPSNIHYESHRRR